MRLDFGCDAVVVGKDRSEYQGKPIYKISLCQGSEAGSFKCNDIVFMFMEQHDLYKPYHLDCTFNDKYGSMTISAISEIENQQKKTA